MVEQRSVRKRRFDHCSETCPGDLEVFFPGEEIERMRSSGTNER